MSINVNEFNLKFLSDLSGKEEIGVDKEGRLFVKEKGLTKTSSVAIEILQGEPFINAQNVVEKFLLIKVRDLLKDKQGKTKLVQFISMFVKNNLLTTMQKKNVLDEWYNLRYEDLKKVYDETVAETMVVTEMAFDPHISLEDREKYYPQETEKGGLSGSYFLKNLKGEIVGIFKPRDQEYGMPLNPKGNERNYDPKKPKITQREGHLQGTSWKNEIAAFELSDKFIGVPETTSITLLFPWPEKFGNKFSDQIGSFQKFAKGKAAIELDDKALLAIPDDQVQKMAIFDMLTLNTDRNEGNFLVDGKNIVPIDHGLCFPTFLDVRGPWFVLPQLKNKIHESVLDWIENFDIDDSVKRLTELGIDKKAILLHKTMYLFLVERIMKEENLLQIAQKCVYNNKTKEITPLQKVINPILTKFGDNEDEYFKQVKIALEKL